MADGSPQPGEFDAIRFLTQEGDKYLGRDRVATFAGLRLPRGSQEADRCAAIKTIIAEYQTRQETSRPLSLAVFGPPGSGKSFAVKELALDAGLIKDAKSDVREYNLSQFSQPSQLIKAFREIQAVAKSDVEEAQKPLLVFFDEFDSALDGQPLAWLRWFLAPMQDGCFIDDGKRVEFAKAVFVFAGGTADRLDEFQRRHAEYFVAAKGPDFISRLRGYIDIGGPNASDHRALRRALLLQHLLAKRAPRLRREDGTLEIEEDLLKSLLDVGRYKHGARSMEALLDMSRLNDAERFDFRRTEQDPGLVEDLGLRRLHLDRGPLDRRTVGVGVGSKKLDPEKLFGELVHRLFGLGATIAHGGAPDKKESFFPILNDISRERGKDLLKDDEKPVWSFVAQPLYSGEPDQKWSGYARLDRLPCLRPEELEELGLDRNADLELDWQGKPNPLAKRHAARSLAMFRMRLRMVQVLDALIVLGGKVERSNGRFPGIAEEVALALAWGVPVYVLGAAGGAARAVGEAMGLGSIDGGVPDCLRAETHQSYYGAKGWKTFQGKLAQWRDRFDPHFLPGLPQDYPELYRFLAVRRPGSDGFPDNGLSVQENRALFAETDPTAAVELVERGLLRLFETHG